MPIIRKRRMIFRPLCGRKSKRPVSNEGKAVKTMIEVKQIDASRKADINIPNEPFPLPGRFVPSFDGVRWSHELVWYAPENVTQMCFPDENYDFDAMADSVFLGAYDGDRCVGLAILQPGAFRYMYLYDLKVNGSCRGRHIGTMLMEKAREIAARQGFRGIYTYAQDNNPAACLFYLHAGFYIGGLDTNVYRHTAQEGKADIIFYSENDPG